LLFTSKFKLDTNLKNIETKIFDAHNSKRERQRVDRKGGKNFIIIVKPFKLAIYVERETLSPMLVYVIVRKYGGVREKS
jgi:hypothetical protein